MPNFAQFDSKGRIHTIMQTEGTLEGINHVEVPSEGLWYLGTIFDGKNFYKLEIDPENITGVNIPVNIGIRWMDKDGNIATSRGGDIIVKCGQLVEVITLVNGTGSLPFESAEPGEYILVATSPEGCEALGKVVVV